MTPSDVDNADETGHVDQKVSSTPSPDATNEQSATSSRKREREASLEPVTTPKALPDVDYKDTRTPAKKNRKILDSTCEEDENSLSRPASPSPPLTNSTTPLHVKMQVRKISQGVEDLTWKNIKEKSQQEDNTADAEATVDEAMQTEATIGLLSSPDGLKRKHDDLTSDHKLSVNGKTDGAKASQGEESVKRARDSLDKDDSSEEPIPPPIDISPSKAKPTGFLAYANPVEPVKRPRDDADKDANPRETKRPSPPPEESTPAKPAMSGFMAYASTSSPFASVKGKNLFAPKDSSASPAFGNHSVASTSTAPFKGTPQMGGFAAFASPSSPFATAARAKSPVGMSGFKSSRRAKSPPRSTRGTAFNDAFSSYAGQPSAFSALSKRTARALSPGGRSSTSTSTERDSASGSTFGSVVADDGSTNGHDNEDEENTAEEGSFGDRLRAGKDEEEELSDEDTPKMALQAQPVTTGEEDEETMYQIRCKLFSLSEENQWKERGTGMLKLNVRIADGSGARLVMRKEAVYTVLLNVTLFKGMQCAIAQDPRYLRFGVIENGATTHYNLRVSSAKIAEELLDEIKANIPN